MERSNVSVKFTKRLLNSTCVFSFRIIIELLFVLLCEIRADKETEQGLLRKVQITSFNSIGTIAQSTLLISNVRRRIRIREFHFSWLIGCFFVSYYLSVMVLHVYLIFEIFSSSLVDTFTYLRSRDLPWVCSRFTPRGTMSFVFFWSDVRC